MEERRRERHGRGAQLPSPCRACPPPRGSPPRSRGFPSDPREQKVRCEPQGPLVNNQRQSYHSGDAKGFQSSAPGTRTKATCISFHS